jgi:serine/threonine-protein kinase RsbW
VTEEERAITVTAPAAADSVAILRTVAANVAGRTEAPIGTVDDLRIAVAEACNRLLMSAPAATTLRMELVPGPGSLEARLAAEPSTGGVTTDEDPASALGWAIIRGLTERAEYSTIDGKPTIVMSIRTSPAER